MTALFLQPTAGAIGPQAGPFMRELIMNRKLPNFLVAAGSVTVLAGLALYLKGIDDFGGLGNYLDSTYGLVLTIGAISAIIALGIGILRTRPTIDRTMQLAGEIGATDGPPPPEKAAELAALQARGRMLAKVVLAFQVVAVLLMSTASAW
jgi:hypothetical protein